MRIKMGSKSVTAVLALFCLMTIVWLACDKTNTKPHSCNGIECKNGSFCNVDTLTKLPKCVCPTGFEGISCGTATLDRYLGYWNMTQVITISDSGMYTKDTSHFQVLLAKTATPTTFFISNFTNNPYYEKITCVLDSANAHSFVCDTISAYHLLWDHYQVQDGFGFMSANDSVIVAIFAVRHLTATSNWVVDSLNLTMTRH